jgi:chorismate mutase
MTDTDYQELLGRIDHQLLKLLKERVRVVAEAREAGDREDETESLDLWVVEGEEMDMDAEAMEKVVRSVLALCKKRNEE